MLTFCVVANLASFVGNPLVVMLFVLNVISYVYLAGQMDVKYKIDTNESRKSSPMESVAESLFSSENLFFSIEELLVFIVENLQFTWVSFTLDIKLLQ